MRGAHRRISKKYDKGVYGMISPDNAGRGSALLIVTIR
ncbi:hypothetical protein TREAZ_1917 [Leadbettera azotonutricia ZAS-9]|uniref:Uncharacterized protein n=1 Tax=Leadbettera azotonutricia (strain ATCC BAA-888 / DSM 13862 / ZAS-9) TaxID=545695 RepID=F5YB93_LEAAZ|nr:hypothetical protein TREAZ_1917 [Leadbettera azotonutricia ZAS-9]